MKPSTQGLTFRSLRSPGPTVLCLSCDTLIRTGDSGRVTGGICPTCEVEYFEDTGKHVPDVDEVGGARGRSLGHGGPSISESLMGNEPTEEAA